MIRVPAPPGLNDTPRRYARTLTEAFGPHHGLAPLHTEYTPMHKHDKIVILGCAVAAVALALIAGDYRA